MDLSQLNSLPDAEAREAFRRCCGSTLWVGRMLHGRPFADRAALLEAAAENWRGLARADILEAFAHHPRIGASKASGWAKSEQSGVAAAAQATLDALAAGNAEYERRFGHIYLVCATGKSADEMLGILKRRLGNAPEAELAAAAGEQAKITALRLEKLLTGR